MRDVDALLERTRDVAEDAVPSGDGFARLREHRSRRERRRRLVGLVGGIAATAAILVLVRSLAPLGEGTRRPGGAPDRDEHTGERSSVEVVVEDRVDGWVFSVIRYRDDLGLYCEDVRLVASGGGCDPDGFRPPPSDTPLAFWLGSAGYPEGDWPEGDPVTYLRGTVSGEVASVEVTWSDGTVSTHEPVRQMFLAARRGAHPTLVTALTRTGGVAATARVTRSRCSGAFGSVGYCARRAGG
jgi:hypothetical protein